MAASSMLIYGRTTGSRQKLKTDDRQEVQNLAEVITKKVVARLTTETIDRRYAVRQ